MQIKDIVNRDLVNLTNCEHEPIHIPGSIQPHGFLLAIDKIGQAVTFCSGNTVEHFGMPFEQLLGKTAVGILGDAQWSAVTDYLLKKQQHSGLQLSLQFNDLSFFCTVHQSGDQIVIEGEPFSAPPAVTGSIYEQTSQFLSYMEDTHTLQQLCQLVAEGTRAITGYDRVMVYRFDKDYNGEVYAESCIETVEPFLGLHYPHTDIPIQARELYMKNLLRLIGDINYIPVPIYTFDDGQNKNIDLSLSVLRSTSPIHIQYLQNMGVGATLTISLIHKGRLWGLIACHHYAAKIITPEIRLAAQLQGHFITSQIDIRQSNEEYDLTRKTNIALEKLNSIELSLHPDSLLNVINSPEILALCNASGAAIVFNNAIYRSANAPTEGLINSLLSTLPDQNIIVTDTLTDVHSSEIDCHHLSGLLVHRLGKNNLIMWFRPESLAEIHWAGDPSKAILKNEKGLSPRNSFALYKETVKCQSKPWLQPELNSAANYAYLLQTHLNLILLSDEEKRNRELNEVLKDTNSELENINWISTHDLQEPLRKIQLNASKLLTSGEFIPKNIELALTRMDNSAKRMQTLLIDIMKYTNLRHTETVFEPIALQPVIAGILVEYHEQIAEKRAIIEVGELPVVYGMPFLLKQLFGNLIINAIKYAKPNVAPLIRISAQEQKPYHPQAHNSYNAITVSDNGIGFESEFKESIFNIFTRLNSDSEYKGSGVGLALCKKIMIAHNGKISAAAVVGEGAEFTCYFPIANTASPAVLNHI